MVNSNDKGKRGERQVVRFLQDNGFDEVQRTKAGRFSDEGDIEGVEGWTLQVKNVNNMSRAIREGIAGMQRQRGQTGDRFGAAIVPVRNKPVGDWYFVMPMYMALDVLRGENP